MSFFATSNANLTPKLHSINVNMSLNGIPVPMLYGRNRLPGLLLWSGDFQSVAQQTPGGKGFSGKDATMYDYLTAAQLALCAGPIRGLPNVFSSNGRLTQSSASETYTVPSGGGSYTVQNASKFAIDHGTARADAYSVTANDYGSPGSITYSGTQQTPMKLVTSSPGAGEYTQSSGTYGFSSADAGKQMTIVYTYSLYVLTEQEDYLIPNTSPFEVTVKYQPYFTQDLGVTFVDTGVPLTIGSGEGQYTVSSGNYTFNSADYGRPVAISYSWNNSAFTTDPISTLQLSVINGVQGQSPWSYMTSKHASMAIGYSGIALVNSPAFDLGPSATMPQYNYEALGPFPVGGGIDDANPADCIQDFLTNSLWGARFPSAWIGATELAQSRAYWQAAGYFISPLLSTQMPAAQVLENWIKAGNCAAFASEGLLKVLPYGDTTLVGNGATYTPQTQPVVDLNDDDFLGPDDADPVQIIRKPRQDAYNHVRVQYNNRLNSYTPEIVDEYDLDSINKFGLRSEGQQNFSFICTLDAASFTANLRLKRLANIRDQYKFTISGVRYWYLEPMDLVTLTDPWLGLNLTPVRIIEIIENANGDYEITAEEFPWGTATATLYPKQGNSGVFPTQAQADPGNVNAPIMFEALDRLTGYQGYELWMCLSGASPNWGGCRVWVSEDGTNYIPVDDASGAQVQNGQCRMGVLTASLPSASSPDTTDTLSVDLTESFGELVSVTDTQAQQLRTICLVDNELIAFATATLTGTYQYGLTYLIRGVLGTTIAAHSSGAPFARLDTQVFKYIFDASQIGKTLYFKFTSFNQLQQQEQSLGDVEAYTFTLTGDFQGAISRTGGAYIGGQGSSSITFNNDFTYTSTTSSLTVSGTVSLYLTNAALNLVSIPVDFTVTGLTAGVTYWLFPYAQQDAYGNWSIAWVVNGDNGITGADGSPAAAFPGATSPLGVSTTLTQFYTKGIFTPLSSTGLSVTIPTSGTGGGTGGGLPPPTCVWEEMLIEERSHGVISAKRLWELWEEGAELFVRDGADFNPIERVSRAATKDWCHLWFDNGEEAITTEGHWWRTLDGKLTTSREMSNALVECDEGAAKATRVAFETELRHFVRFVVKSHRQTFNTGMRRPSLITHNFFTT